MIKCDLKVDRDEELSHCNYLLKKPCKLYIQAYKYIYIELQFKFEIEIILILNNLWKIC